MVGIIFFMGVTTMWYLGKQAAVDIAVRGFLTAIGKTPTTSKSDSTPTS
jgi:hypothetical protein